MHDAGQEVAREHGGEQAQRDEVRGKIDRLQLPFAAGEEGPGVGGERQAQRPAADRHRRHRDQEAAGVARQHPVDQRPPLALERDRRQLVLPARDLGVQVVRPALAVLGEPLPERQVAHRRGDQRQQQQQCHKRRGGPQPLRVGYALDMLDEAREWVTPVHLRPSLRGACRRQAHLLDGRCPFECPPAGAPKLAWNCANRKAPFLIWVDAAMAPYRSGGRSLDRPTSGRRRAEVGPLELQRQVLAPRLAAILAPIPVSPSCAGQRRRAACSRPRRPRGGNHRRAADLRRAWSAATALPRRSPASPSTSRRPRWCACWGRRAAARPRCCASPPASSKPTAGRVLINDQEVAGPDRFVPPEKRNVGLMFQDFALFPHLYHPRQRRLRPQVAAAGGGAPRGAGGAGPRRPGALRQRLSAHPLGRRAAARRAGPRHPAAPGGDADGRAVLRPRRAAARAHAGGDAGACCARRAPPA